MRISKFMKKCTFVYFCTKCPLLTIMSHLFEKNSDMVEHDEDAYLPQYVSLFWVTSRLHCEFLSRVHTIDPILSENWPQRRIFTRYTVFPLILHEVAQCTYFIDQPPKIVHFATSCKITAPTGKNFGKMRAKTV